MFKSERQKIYTYILFGIYIVMLMWLILFKFSVDFTDLPHIRNINLIPFAQSAVVNGRISISEIAYNVIVFIPMGVLVSMCKKEWGFVRKALPAFAASLVFETLQYAFAIGASDITDLIGNTLGGIIGILVFALLVKMWKEKAVLIINIIATIILIMGLLMLGVLIVSNM